MSRTFSLNVASPYPTKPFDSGAGSLDQRMLVLCGNDKVDSATSGTWMGTVKLSRIRPFCGRMPLELRLGINDLAAAAGGENAAKLLNLTPELCTDSLCECGCVRSGLAVVVRW